jgi:serralysin
VSAGSILGYVGNTGLRTGTHLHVTYGLDDTTWTAGIIANGSRPLGTPVTFDTANGQIGPGIVSQVTFDLTSQTLAADRHNLYLMGSSSINGFGDNYANLISGNRGNNLLDGRSGNDVLLGGSGNDTLIGGAGNDTLNGGAGSDTASYLGSTSGVTVSLAISSQQNTGTSTGYDTLVSIENLIGSSYGDRLTGSSASNLIDAGSGNDRIDAGSGNDTVYGGAGNDILIGGSGRDTLNGGSGNDILTGGADQDNLFGGAGADYFDFNLTSDSRPGSNTRDVIRDFQIGDRIDLRDIDANTLLSGDQAFRFIGSQSFHRIAGELSFSGGIVRGDTNGDGVADFEIQVIGVNSLSMSDFIL